MTRHRIFAILFLVSLLFTCKGVRVTAKEPAQDETIGFIDIPSPGYFFLLRPWKKGTIATMDGNARFAEISFTGKSGMSITPMIDFPRKSIDRTLVAMPESGVCVTKDSEVFYIADTANKKTKEYAPLMWWAFDASIPVALDTENGIINFRYSATDGYRRQSDYRNDYNIIYDAKNDQVLYESPKEGEAVSLNFPLTPEIIWSQKWNKDGTSEIILYNWKTRETTENELIRKYNRLGARGIISRYQNISLERRCLFANLPVLGETNRKKVKITWDENYEDVKVIPLDYMIPEGKWMSDFYISADGEWASSFMGSYKGYYGELLDKRVFFHLDGRYPNGISMPVYVDDYYLSSLGSGTFVEHPEYGMCFAEEKLVEDGGKERRYLRLHKMDYVLKEINRQLLENAEDV
jgi:hypothetical protein